MISKSIRLACGLERAFELFTQHASAWWPPERRHTPDPRSQIQMLESGRFFERAADGTEIELGRVRAWEPPHRLLLDFYPGTDAEHPTEVQVTFVADGSETLVTLQHRPTQASEALWKLRAPKFEASWDLLLPALAAAARG
jgi:uncharacterized protein YndB with AHSA1/START domain